MDRDTLRDVRSEIDRAHVMLSERRRYYLLRTTYHVLLTTYYVLRDALRAAQVRPTPKP